MTKLAILDDYQRVARSFADWSAVDQRCAVTVFDQNIADIDVAGETLGDFDIICAMRERMPFPRAMFERLPRLRLLVTTGAKNRSIDLEAATDHGVVVCGTGGQYSMHTTAELAWTLILAAMRHLPTEERNMRGGGWQTTVGRGLHGKTLGIIGLGRIGARLAVFGNAFGMKVLAWSQNLTADDAQAKGAERVEKEELLARADVVTLHLVLSARTRGIIGVNEIGLMKPGALLVNTSRGPLVDEDALLRALQEKHICAGLDVYDEEPLPPAHPLRFCDNAVLTPHLGYVSREVYDVFYKDTAEDVLAFLKGEPVRVLNPEVLERLPRLQP
jgi:phosphoglycerate dehydrogenase-like enzyme